MWRSKIEKISHYHENEDKQRVECGREKGKNEQEKNGERREEETVENVTKNLEYKRKEQRLEIKGIMEIDKDLRTWNEEEGR